MMACWLSEEDKESQRRHRQIERQLRQDDRVKNWKKEVKILLLGAGESGKSTFLKQMRIIHGEDYSVEDRIEFRPLIYHNILKGMKVLIEVRKRLQIPFEDPNNEGNADIISAYHHRTQELAPQDFAPFVDPMVALWQDQGIRTTLQRSNEFQLGDQVSYLLRRLEYVGAPDYVPSREDVLHSRKATRGIHEYVVPIKSVQFRFVDVGGQRSQRQKWFSCFDDVTAILFLVACSGYNQTILEDRVTNRLIESLNIFETIVNNRCFRHITIIIFFNKYDLLQDKIQKSNISEFFPNFRGDPRNLDHVKGFLVGLYDEVRRNLRQDFYHHFTTATNTENIKKVFKDVKDSILKSHIDELMQI